MSTHTGPNRHPNRATEKRRRDFGIIGRAHVAGAAAFVSRLPLEHGAKLLDVGCGTGNVSIAAARAGADVTGVDPREPFLSRGRAWSKNENLLVRFKPAHPGKLPFSDGNFHAVVNFLGLPSSDEPSVAAAQMARVCRRRGLLAVAAWDPDGPVADILRITFRYSGDERLARSLELCDPESLQSLFRDLGPPEWADSRETTLFFPLSARETADCYLAFYPPVREAARSLEPEAREALAADLASHLSATGATGEAGLELEAAHHELHFRKP